MIERFHIIKSRMGGGRCTKICAVAFAVMMVAVTLAVVDADSFDSVGEYNAGGIEINKDTPDGIIEGFRAKWVKEKSVLEMTGCKAGYISIDCTDFKVKDITVTLKGKNTIDFTYSNEHDCALNFISPEGNIVITGSNKDSLNIIVKESGDHPLAMINASGPQSNTDDAVLKIENVNLGMTCAMLHDSPIIGIDTYGHSIEFNNAKFNTVGIDEPINTNLSVKIVKSDLNFSYGSTNEIMPLTAITASKGIKQEGCVMPDSGCQYWTDEPQEGRNVQ